jgi:hypothetical protein
MAQKSTAPSLPEKVVRFIEASSVMAEKAASREQEQLAFEKEADALIPGLVDLLASIQVEDPAHGTFPLLEPDEKVACAQALKDPARTLHILVKVAKHFKKAQADRLGQPQTGSTKQASHETPYTGRRRGAQEPASWQQFRQRVMGS